MRPAQLAALAAALLTSSARAAATQPFREPHTSQPVAASAAVPAELPDAPQPQTSASAAPAPPNPAQLPLCGAHRRPGSRSEDASARSVAQGGPPCRRENPLQSIVSSPEVEPLNPAQKAILAGKQLIDPFSLLTLVASSAVATAANAHSAYGPGLKGFARQTGYGLAEDAEGESLGTFLIPTLAHEDPRYHRMPDRTVPVRILHAVAHTVVAEHDDGRLMPNYAVLGSIPITQASFNLYVPGLDTSASATGKRIAFGIATNPVGDIIAEFLPDVARRIHVRVFFFQEILNKVAQQPGVQ